MKCLKCGYVNDNDAEFCENCGSALAQVCPNCNNPLKPGASFCKKCGAPVSSQKASPDENERLARFQQSAPPQLKDKLRISAAQLEGERKLVTILFTDIVGSTSLAEKLDPEEWKEVVSGAHQHVSKIIHHYEGTIAQLLGDGVLAFFGAPITHEDDPVRAVRAALDIQEEIDRYAYELRGYIHNFQMRIGLNTGTVVVGSVGSDLHMEYLAIGDSVNLAARLQSSAQPGKVLISENTARLVKTAFELIDLGEIAVKGKAEQVRVYEARKLKTIPVNTRGFEELDSPLIGRSKELIELVQALDELSSGHGRIVAIFGEAGIGKSRLVEEAHCSTLNPEDKGKTGGSRDLHWIEGRALSYGSTLSFWSISQLIKNDLGLSDADPEPRVRLALGRRVNQLFGEQADEVLPYLAQLLGIRLEDRLIERVSLLDGETLKRQMLVSITQYLEKMATLQPTVAVFEDLHWADPSSLEALEMLLSVTDRAPLMLLLLSRLEREQPSWHIKLIAETDFAHRYIEIQLKPLSAGEQNQLVDNLLRIADLPSEVRQLIQEHAEGNPFYLEEIVRSLIEQGAIIRESDHWNATRLILDVDIPDTLQGLLLARLDRLQEDVRRTLQLASVIGRSFLYSILGVISEAEQQLDQHLSQLQRVDLVREKARLPELEYMFKHSLTQEAAYSSLLVSRRYEFHRKVGEALEKLFPERLQEFYGILAHHYESAGENQKAIDYLVRAGDKARLMAELTEAIGYYQRTIPLLTAAGDTSRLAQVWLKLGLVYSTTFQFENAHHANEQAFALQKLAETPRLASVKMKPAKLRMCMAGGHITLDPGIVSWVTDFRIASNLFAGLVQVDAELNVVPDVARSWQVLDGGRRYLFTLRDDMRWSDGSPLTAQDFEYAWKHNLRTSKNTFTVQYLFDVDGAQDYLDARNSDPMSVGVRALNEHTLEVRLLEPVAYFLFILSLPIAFPLPRKTIELFGENWWREGNMVCNGPYRLVKFDPSLGSALERNPYYHGEFLGNIEQVELTFTPDASQVVTIYQENAADLVFLEPHEMQASIMVGDTHLFTHLRTTFIQFAPRLAPLDDVRIRKALALALDREELLRTCAIKSADGGLIPPGMPGHSPDIGLRFDPKTARQLLAEAGYPNGEGLPVITGLTRPALHKIGNEISRQWHDHLGIDVSIEPKTQHELTELRAEEAIFHLYLTGWLADYPDPDNILCQLDSFLFIAHAWGWNDEVYNKLVKEAGRTANQKQRMEMYRQADRMLVQEQVLILPIDYGGNQTRTLIKPWVKNLKITPTGRIMFKDIILEEH